MKRSYLHILFWLVYLFQDALLHFTWMAPSMKSIHAGEQIAMAIATAFALLLPKLAVVYYFIFRGLKKIMDDRREVKKIILETSLVLVLSLLFFRLIFHYGVLPGIYSVNPKVSFFDAKNTLIAILDMGYVTGVAIALKLLRLQAASKEREKNLVREKLETELKLLRSQTNPHFLFNTLNNIYALARKKADETPEVVMKLSGLLSFMLYESGKESITIGEEIRMMEDYLDLEKLRYSNRLVVQFTKEIDDLTRPIAPLLLLPLVENAFKHGISETRFDSIIRIDITVQKEQLVFFIENTVDNGNRPNGDNRLGLHNVKRQLELMYKDHEITVADTGATFSVLIRINLDSYGKV